MSELEPLVIGDLVVEKPIIQGGMGVGTSLHKLVGAMTKVGSMDIMSVAQTGFRESDLTTNSVEANVRSIRREMRLVREVAPQGAIGLNIVVTAKYYDIWVKETVKMGADIIISGAGLPVSLPEYAEAAYAEMREKPARRIKLAPIALSAKSAMIVYKIWDRECHTASGLVVVGRLLAGGHLGFPLDQLSTHGADTTGVPTTYDRDAYDREVKTVMKAVEGYGNKHGRHMPVTTAGGIYIHEDMVHQLKLDADGVQTATGFVTAEEYDASDAYKQTYINAGKEDTVITQSPVGIPGRIISDPFLSRIKSGSRSAVRSCPQCLKYCDVRIIPYYITMVLVNAVEGGTDHGLLFCGSNAYHTEKVDTVDNIIEELTGKLA